MYGIPKTSFGVESGCRFGVGILDKSQMQGEYIGSSAEGGKICAPILRKKINMTKGETSFCI